MIVPCQTSPLRGICSKFKTLDEQIASLQAEGAIDLSGYAEVGHVHDPPDLSGYATDADLASGLSTKADVGHWHGGETISQRFKRECDSSHYLSTYAAGVSVPGTSISMVISPGSTVEFDVLVPLWFPSNSGKRNAHVIAEFGGYQKFVGQVYLNSTIGMVHTMTGKIVFDDVSGAVSFVIKVSAMSGCLLIMNDLPERYCKVYAKVYYDFSP